ncbi:MAG TPA: hypothetical protein VNL77_05635, partial [Roseiflexaceae bacterium]|nr:hypothetical protein [Roseiflexaceae bacterium]
MWTARLLIGILALALLAPIPAAAAPAASFHSCDAMLVALPPPVREALLRMGGTLTAIDETTVTLGGQQVTLRVCAPAAQRLQALRMLDLIAVALPALERHAGVHDLGGMEREIIILPTAEMDDLGADGVHTDAGVIYLHASSFEWAVVHEAAHYWARPDTFAEGWMVEGYADYLTELAAAELPTPLVSPQPDSRCEGVALAAERRISRCIYRRGAQVFRDMAAAVGPDLLRTTLRQLSDGRRRVDSWRLMVALELASGKDLSAIFDGMVFPFGADEVRRWIELRSALWLAQRLAEAEQLALPEWLALAEADWRRGAIPSPALQEGRPAPEAFTPEMRDAEALLHPLVAALRQVGEVRQLCARLALTCATPWRPLPTLPEPAAQLAADLTAAIGLLGAYSQLVQEAAAAEVAAPAPLKRIAESLDIGGGHAIQRARDLLPRAVALDGACKAYPAPCAGGWHAAWSSGDLDAVERTVSVLEAVLERARQVEASCGETLEGCRRIWQSALEAGGPPAAEESLAHLEQLRAGAQQVSAACRSLGEECWQVWERPLAAGDLRGAQAALAAA